MLDLKGKPLILASKSPRRAQLLRLLNLEFRVVESGVEEEDEHHVLPEVHVLELAEKKAATVAREIQEGYVIGADTTVALDKQIFAKPRNKDEARSMLRQLSGKTHTVFSAFTIVEQPRGRQFSDYEKTSVEFHPLDDEMIEAYVRTDSPMDKAGAYGIQDLSAIFVKRIDGCFYNVVGFPVSKFYRAFRAFMG